MKHLKKNVKKALTATASAAVVLSLSVNVLAEKGNTTTVPEENNSNNTSNVDGSNVDYIPMVDSANVSGKEETVYIIQDADGKNRQVIVSDWLRNGKGVSTLDDISDLKDIVNVAGDETFTQGADGKVTWNADGSDIYYRGTTDKELPVDVKISYTLDGKAIGAEELAGKNGHVTIRFDYTNNTTKRVLVNGRYEDVKVPFAMISGVALSNEKFSNLTVTNGKIIADGKNSYVVGMAFPGMEESLKLSSDLKDKMGDYDIPEYVEIEADVQDFSLEMTMTVANADFLNELDVDSNNMNDLQADMDKLTDGANDLQDGAQQLKDGTGELVNGVNDLYDGTAKLKDGTGELDDGADKLKDGAGKLDSGAADIKAGTSALASDSAGIPYLYKSVHDSLPLLATLSAGTQTLANAVNPVVDEKGELVKDADGNVVHAGLENSVKALNAGAQSLASEENGIPALYDTVHGSLESIKELSEGASALAAGLNNANNGVNSLYAGMHGTGDGADHKPGLNDAMGSLSSISTNASAIATAANDIATAAETLNDVGSVNTKLNSASTSLENALTDLGDIKSSSGRQLTEDDVNDLVTVNATSNATVSYGDGVDVAVIKQSIINTLKGKGVDDETIEAIEGDLNTLCGAEVTLGDATVNVSVDADKLSALNASIPSAVDNTDTITAIRGNINSAKTSVDNAKTSIPDVSESTLSGLKENATNLNTSAGQLSASAATITGSVQKISDGIDALHDSTTGIPAAVAGAAAINDGINGTAENPIGLYKSILMMDGTDAVTITTAAGERTVSEEKSGLYKAAAGTKQLAAGTTQLNASVPTLVGGINQINDGINGTTAKPIGLYKSILMMDGTDAVTITTATGEKTVSEAKSGLYKAAAGTKALDAGAATLQGGTKDLVIGADDLKSGTKKLNDGAGELMDGVVKLRDGAHDLDDGAQELLDGMIKFNDEGIKKLADIFGGDLTDVVDRLEALKDAGCAYNNFSGASENEGNQVKFIFKTNAIKKED